MPIAAETTPASERRPSAGGIAAAIGLGLAAFLATAGILHAAILVTSGDPLYLHADLRSEKLAILNDTAGKVFSAAFGSSHVHDGFDPRVFDATLTGSPIATHSVNLAIEGGSQSEQFVMASEFLRHLQAPIQVGAPKQPCLVILELGAGSNFTSAHLVHPRSINIYNWQTTQLITHFVTPQMPRTQRYGRIGYALAAMGLHYANVGMLSDQIFAPPLSDRSMEEFTADDRRGIHAMEYHASLMSWIYAFEARLPKHPVITPAQPLPGNAEMVERLARVNPDRTVSFVYVEMPRLGDLGAGNDYPDHLIVNGPHGPLEVPIINLGRADKFPEMYNPEIWYDDSHVDGQGAKVVTRILAEQLKQWYAVHGGPTPCQ